MKLRAGILAASLLAAGPAFAQEPSKDIPTTQEKAGDPVTTDVVHLRNGGMYRGHVTEIVPTDHVTIFVEHGAEKKIPWSEVDRVIVATTQVPPLAPSAPTAPDVRPTPGPTPPLAAPMVGPRVRVHIVSSTIVLLYRRPAGTTSWSQACTSPCDKEMPLGDGYRVTGNGVAQSSEFQLSGAPGSTVDVKIDPPSTGGMVMGAILGGVASLVGEFGLLLLLDSIDRGDDRDEKNVGLVATGVGAAGTLGGILIFLAAAKTDVDVVPSQPDRSGRDDRFRRQPTWKSAERTGLPAAQFPILFSHAF